MRMVKAGGGGGGVIWGEGGGGLARRRRPDAVQPLGIPQSQVQYSWILTSVPSFQVMAVYSSSISRVESPCCGLPATDSARGQVQKWACH